jgi:hypothetical protein
MKTKKIISAILAAVMMLSLTISVSAETMFERAKEVKVNSSYKVELSKKYGAVTTVKFTLTTDTTITISMDSDLGAFKYKMFNSNGEEKSPKNLKETSGYINSYYVYDDDDTGFAKVSADYTLSKGTYYFQLDTDSDTGNYVKFKISDPNAKSVTALSLSITVDTGDTLDLGGVVTPSNSKITWKSSNTEVATVSADGTVEAVAAGKATITATAGGKTASITIVVN